MYKMNHVGIMIKDSNVSTEFYCNVLGCEVINTLKNEQRELIFLKAGEGVIELINKFNQYEERTAGVVDHIAFTVENLEEAIEGLKKNNVKLLIDKPMEVENMRIIFFEGPDGERLEFVEYR